MKLEIRQDRELGTFVPGLTDVSVTNIEVVMDLMEQAKANRSIGAHELNEHSSRFRFEMIHKKLAYLFKINQ